MKPCTLPAALTLVALTSSLAPAQLITVLQPSPGYQISEAFYVSPGGVAVGTSVSPGTVYTPHPTRWSAGSGTPQALGEPAGGGGGEPFRCSDDGQTVVGRWMPDANTNTPALWGPTGSFTALQGPGSVSVANGVSADGSIVTGWSSTAQGRWLLRWQNATPTQTFGPSFVSGPCSPDGSTALGINYLGGTSAALAQWNTGGGPNGSIQTLAQFPAPWSNIGAPTAMTPAADAAVGLAAMGGGTTQSWIWRNGQLSAMGVLAGYVQMNALSITANANLVVGSGIFQVQPGLFQFNAAVWTPSLGWQTFSDYLSARGISFPGWTFTRIRSVSADGLTFAGGGVTPQGDGRGFVITIPSPSSLSTLLLAGLIARRRTR